MNKSYSSLKTIRELRSLLKGMVPEVNALGFVESKSDDSHQYVCTCMFLYVSCVKAVFKQQLKWNML